MTTRLLLTVRAKPGAAKPGITARGGQVVVAVRERAVDGRANAGVVRAVAAWLDVAPSRVTLVRGAAARTKQLAIAGLDEAGLATALARLE